MSCKDFLKDLKALIQSANLFVLALGLASCVAVLTLTVARVVAAATAVAVTAPRAATTSAFGRLVVTSVLQRSEYGE